MATSNVMKSSNLIDSLKRKAFLPSDQNTFTNQDFLNILNEELQYFVLPRLMRTHEEYLVTFEDITTVTNQSRYPIPRRAIGNKLRDAAFVIKDNTNDSIVRYHELSRVSLEDLSDFNEASSADYNDSFYVEGDSLVLVDQLPVSDAFLRFFFYLTPNTLVLDAEAGVITDINTTTGVVTLSNFPSRFSSLPDMDFVQANTANRILGYDITPTAVDVNAKTVTFTTTDLPSRLIVGDYLNFAGETIVPQLPTELHAILAQRGAVSCLQSLGDAEGLSVAQTRLDMMVEASNDLIDNRVEGAQEKIRNRHGSLSQAVLGSRGYRRRGGV